MEDEKNTHEEEEVDVGIRNPAAAAFSDAVEIRWDAERGRHGVARRELRPGQVAVLGTDLS